jgi:hypothetical protein
MVIDMSETELEVSGVTIRLQVESNEKCDLRDQFAMAALTGLLANPDAAKYKDRAEVAYNYADAMLKAREKKDD